MGVIASQITSLMIVYWTDYSDADQRKYQSFASLAFLRGIHWGPVNSPHNWPATRKMFPFDDVIMMMLFLLYHILPHHPFFSTVICFLLMSYNLEQSQCVLEWNPSFVHSPTAPVMSFQRVQWPIALKLFTQKTNSTEMLFYSPSKFG